MAGGHANGPPDGAAKKTVYRVRVGRLEDAGAEAQALAERLAPGEAAELEIEAADGRVWRVVIDADDARRADAGAAGTVRTGRNAFIVRMADASMAPRFRVGDYLEVDLDMPTGPGRFVAVDDGDGGVTVRLLAAEGGRRVLRALAPGWPERTLDAPFETLIWGVVVFAGRAV